jgi:hypothetical protein
MGLFDKLLRKRGVTPKDISNKANVVPIKASVVPLRAPTVPVPAIPSRTLTVDADSEAHLFHSTGLGFALYFHNIGQGSVLTVGERIPLACMFSAYWLTLDRQKIGYLFTSQFQVTNKGGYIMAYMNAGAGKASAVEVLVKTDNLVVYHFPNHGTLVVSPHMGEDMTNILSEQ